MAGLVLAGMVVGPHGVKILHSHTIALSALGDFGLLRVAVAGQCVPAP
jgi:hypothetical protein